MPYGFWTIGDGMGARTRLAVSFTPSSTIDMTHWSLVGKKFSSWHVYFSGTALQEVNHLEWELRYGLNHTVDEGRPALATGVIDFSGISVWKLGRIIEYTVVLDKRVRVTEGVEYFFVVKTPEDEYNLLYPFAWAFDPDEVDNTKYSTGYYDHSSWAAGDNTTTLLGRVFNDQAGSEWHVIIDGLGYMTPAKLSSYRSEQISSGLAATRGGQEEYSQLLYPYSNLSQESWELGSGQLQAEDPRKFYYAGNMDTVIPSQAILGPLPHRTGTAPPITETVAPQYEADQVTERQLIDPEYSTVVDPVNYYAQRFIADLSSYDVVLNSVGVRVARLPYRVQYELQVCICEDIGDVPQNVLLGGITGWQTLESHWWWYWQDMPVNGILTHDTPYWVVVRTTQPWGSLPEHKVMFDRTGSGYGVAHYSSGGVVWNLAHTLEQSMIYRINGGSSSPLHGDVSAFAYGLLGDFEDERLFAVAAGKKVYIWNETNGAWDDISAGISAVAPYDQTLFPITDLTFFDGNLLVAQGYGGPVRVWDKDDGWIPATTANLILGGDFESQIDLDQWTVPTGTLSSVSGGFTGNYGQLVSGPGGSDEGEMYQDFGVLPGQTIFFSFYHLDDPDTGDATIRDADDPIPVLYDFNVQSDVEWTPYFVSFIVPEGVSNLRIHFDCGGGNSRSAGWDNVFAGGIDFSAKYFHRWGGYLWSNPTPNTIQYSNSVVGISEAFEVGETQWEITGFGEYNDLLLVGKEDGLYQLVELETGGYLTKNYFTFQGLMDPYNGINMDNWSSQLFIPIQRRGLLSWRGSSYIEVGPTDDLSGQSDYYKTTIGDLIPHTRMLFVSMASENWGFGGVFAYNGLGWHHLIRQDHWGVESSNAGFVTTTVGGETRVWYSRGARPWYFKLSAYTHNRYDDADVDYNLSVGDLVSSWWHGGVKDAFKFWNRVTLLADIPEGTFIEVHYAVDGEDWIKTQNISFLGRLTPAAKKVHKEYTLMFPDGLVAKSIQLIFRLHTTDVALSPRLRAYNVESVVRQIPVDAYSFRILLSTPQTRLGTSTETERSGEDMWQELKRARAKNAPISVYFPGKAMRGMITYLAETTFQYKPVGSEDTRWERVAEVTIHEAT